MKPSEIVFAETGNNLSTGVKELIFSLDNRHEDGKSSQDLEVENSMLKKQLSELTRENAKLEHENSDLRRSIEDLSVVSEDMV